MADFEARVGDEAHPGLAGRAERLARITPGSNPYVTGHSLPPDSPVFFGRERELAETLGVLRLRGSNRSRVRAAATASPPASTNSGRQPGKTLLDTLSGALSIRVNREVDEAPAKSEGERP